MDAPVANIVIPYTQIRAFCEQQHIRKLALFGSVLRSDFRPDSDVDVLVEYEPDARIGLLEMAGQEIELGRVIARKVDLRTAEDLSRYFRQQVLDEALTVYERA